MKVRIGIDLNGDNWVDWDEGLPPNLIPDALHFDETVLASVNLTREYLRERSQFGLMVHRLHLGAGYAAIALGQVAVLPSDPAPVAITLTPERGAVVVAGDAPAVTAPYLITGVRGPASIPARFGVVAGQVDVGLNLLANIVQTLVRGRWDDDDEQYAQWIDAANEPFDLDTYGPYRIRFRVDNDKATEAALIYKLQINLNNGGWKDLDAVGPYRYSQSPNVSNITPITQQLGVADGPFAATTVTAAGNTSAATIASGGFAEMEFVLAASQEAGATTGDEVLYRLVEANSGDTIDYATNAIGASTLQALPSPLTPPTLPGGSVWFDAEYPNTLFKDTSKTTPAKHQGDVIQGWVRRAGPADSLNSVSTAQLSAGSMNGKNGVWFFGDQHLTSAASSPAATFYAAVVFKLSPGSTGNVRDIFGTAATNGLALRVHTDNTLRLINVGINVMANDDKVLAEDTVYLVECTYNNSTKNFKLWVNGVLEHDVVTPAFTIIRDTLTIGGARSGFRGPISDFILLESIPDSTLQTSIRSFLMAKWEI